MVGRGLLGVILACGCASAPARAGEADEGLRPLQGVWRPVRLERGGAVVKDAFAADARFVVVGRRISYRFARLNIVAQILDNVIELPLTTVLRLLRQWTAFLRNKQDDLSQ